MNRQAIYIILLAILIPLFLKAQDIHISSIPFPSYYTPSTIVDLDQDKYGNIWMATTDQGIIKYSGEDFTMYTNISNNSNSLISNRLECIYIDNRGLIWIGSFASGLSRYDPNTETFIHFVHDESDPNSIRSNGIRSLTEDKNGGIWIGTLKGMNYWNPDTEKFEDILVNSPDENILNEEHIRVMYVDKSGMIWAGSSGPFVGESTEGGLFKIDPITYEVKRYAQNGDSKSITNNTVTAILEDSRGNFWVGTAGDGLHTMDRELGEFTHHSYDPTDPSKLSRFATNDFSFAQDHIRFIQEDFYGNIWIGTMGNGITKYDPNSDEAIHLNRQRNDQYQLSRNSFWSSLRTNDDQLWFTGWFPSDHNNILYKANLDPLVIDHTEVNRPIYSFEEGEDGMVYMTSEDILFKMNKDEDLTRVFEQAGAGFNMRNINRDDEGDLWISSVLGLLHYDTQSGDHQLYPIRAEDSGEQLSVLYTDDWTSDSILVGTTAGLYLFDQDEEKFTHIPYLSDDVPDSTRLLVEAILIDSRRNIWIGYSNIGLKKLSHDLKSFKDYTFLRTVQDGTNTIYEDQFQNLYVANRRSGIRKYDNESDAFTAVIDQYGGFSPGAIDELGVNGIKSISDSILWLMTNKGLLKYDISKNAASDLDIRELKEYEITSSGLFSSTNGDYFLGTSNGYIKFKPEDWDRKIIYRYAPSISKILIGEVNYTQQFEDSDDEIDLKYNENNVSFTLSYVNLASSTGSNKLEFILENHDPFWRAGENEEEVFYFNLSPGTYQFNVKAIDRLGGEITKSVAFKIKPPWWKTWWAYLAYGILFGFGIWRVQLFQKSRILRLEKEKARQRELAHAKEIEMAYNDLELTHKNLKATQAQLIQSEKMASLGELTAGIAHEIQNPLNFVNNFSEVSEEMIDEVNEEMDSGDVEEAKLILQDLKSNLGKIHHHGKRADSIVKGMLLHSRTSTGEKVETEINALCDEFLRLSYHGMRAKDRNFNADFELNLDPGLPKVKVVPQDIGRVLLNIINNAFQACADRNVSAVSEGQISDAENRESLQGLEALEGVNGLVKVFTKNLGDKIKITISDSGPGIPKDIKEKIFQPFFTTKPTGEGTGLGLSLAYDIVKAHGGEIKVETEKSKGTDFIIMLPI